MHIHPKKPLMSFIVPALSKPLPVPRLWCAHAPREVPALHVCRDSGTAVDSFHVQSLTSAIRHYLNIAGRATLSYGEGWRVKEL